MTTKHPEGSITMPVINRDVPIPIYYQLKQLIKDQVERGVLKPGDQIPSEDELCTRYGISRTPVRQALTELVHEGLLVRIHGRGTFVAEPASALEAARGTTLRIVLNPRRRWRPQGERRCASSSPTRAGGSRWRARPRSGMPPTPMIRWTWISGWCH
jgi:DNA-binding transcriptional regulator YhcF (GntR family)